jgi:uncharacterized protein (TIGR02466 family)
MNSFNVVPLFSVPFYVSSVETINDTSKNKIKNLSYERLKINNGYISNEKYILDQPEFIELKKQITNHIELFVRNVMHVDNCLEFYITNSWVMKHSKGDWSQKHSHSNSLLSGVLYVDVDKDSGVFRVHKNFQSVFPSTLEPKFNEFNPFNTEWCDFIPKNNDIFIFSSNLDHEVTVSNSTNERYCLAFNIFMKGSLGLDKDIKISTLYL